MLNRSASLEDLRTPYGNRLERLKDDRKGQWSIRINDQWRICFVGRKETHTMLKSLTTTRKSPSRNLLPNPHPGEILLEEFLKPAELSQNALARAIGVSPRRINEIVLGQRAITADTDLRLARYYGMSEGFFLGLQMDYDLMEQRRLLGDKLKAIKPRAA